MVTLVMHSKDERTRNAALLRYTCGHDGRYFGLFHLIVMDHHIVINSRLVFCIVVYHYEVRCVEHQKHQIVKKRKLNVSFHQKGWQLKYHLFWC